MTEVRHAVHPGVTVRTGYTVDAARRLTLDTAPAAGDPDLVAASLIATGCARLEHSAADRMHLLLAVLAERSLAPIRALRLGFARRHAQGGAPTVVWHVLMAARLPILAMALGIGGVALVTGLLTGELVTPLSASAWAVLSCAVSIICHESAHLLALRTLARDRTIGAIEHSWLSVWIVGPAGCDRAQRVTALAGPLAGMLACVALAYAGVAGWICWMVGFVHAANLFPLAPDGRIVFSHAGGRGRRQPAAAAAGRSSSSASSAGSRRTRSSR
jgi:hypothetical protein